MEAWKVPGVAIAVVKDDKVVLARGFGVREAGKPERVDDQTLFAIGSLTKGFTAAAAGVLVDEGKLAWDDFQLDAEGAPTRLMVEDWGEFQRRG